MKTVDENFLNYLIYEKQLSQENNHRNDLTKTNLKKNLKLSIIAK